MFIKPAAGLKIRDPYFKDFLPEAGREVTDSFHWQRLLKDGDITISAKEVAAETAAPAKKI